MRANNLLGLIAFTLILTFGFAANPKLSVGPVAGTYVKNGSTLTLSLTVQDDDVDGNSAGWLGIELYYSKTPNFFEIFIGDYNLSDTSKPYCPDNNFKKEVNCDISWTVNIPQDGNYYIDFNIYEMQGPTVIDFNKDVSSDSFYVDNTVPEITLLYPSTSCGTNLLCTDTQQITFDVNDFGSGVSLSTITISVQGSQSSYFNASSHCSANDGNYHCDYNELAIVDVDDNPYTIIIKASDNVENESGEYVYNIKYLDDNAPEAPTITSATPGPGKITVEWNSVEANDLNGYKIYYSTQSGDFNIDTGTYGGFTTQTSYILSDLNSDLNYYIKVVALDYSGNISEMSNYLKAKPEPVAAPAAPTLTSTEHTNNEWSNANDVTITWQTEDGVSYFCIWDTSSNANPTTECTPPYEKSNVNDGTYYFRVKACRGSNCSCLLYTSPSPRD